MAGEDQSPGVSSLRRVLLLSALMVAMFAAIPKGLIDAYRANYLRPHVPHRTSVVERIVLAAADAGLPPRIAVLRFWYESRWRHTDASGYILESNGNCGIAQLNRRYTRAACAMTEEESIREGVRQLAGYQREFGERLALIAYTHGPSIAHALQRGE